MEEETKKSVAKVKLVEVKVIEKVGKSYLVEYYDPKKGPFRVTIPAEIIKEGKVPLTELEVGVPHGVDWSKVKVKSIDSEELSKSFRNEGIFTLEDLGQKRQAALACIYRLSGLMLSDIIEQTKE